MVATRETEATKIRRKVGHPILDADGHMLEVTPALWDYIKDVGGSRIIDKFNAYCTGPGQELFDHLSWAGWEQMTVKERRETGTGHGLWWFLPAETDYRATCHLPSLMHQRMDEFGLDFACVFGTWAVALLALPGIPDEEVRRAACRGYNNYIKDTFGEYADRMTPSAAIPMHNPQEAIEELDYAVNTLGLKLTIFPSYVVRPIKRNESNKHLGARLAPWYLDFYGIDSDYDYDPVWQKCIELGVAPCFHSTATGLAFPMRNSATNSMFHTVGNFAESGNAIAKALFMGGVTRRFPKLRFGFLEGGAGRGVLLYANMLGFWEKRTPRALRAYTDPRKLNTEELGKFVDEYGHERIKAKKDEWLQEFALGAQAPEPDVPGLDDWYGAKIERPEQFKELFQDNMFYGCEADDPTTAWAFNTKANPFGAKIRAFMGSDIGHCDVIDPTDVVPEAYELVEHGLLNEAEWKDFVFTNAVLLYGGMNPDFFKGSPAEAEAAKVLAEHPQFQPDPAFRRNGR